MKKKQFETVLYSVVGVAAMFLVLVLINYVVAAMNARVDLTADKLYTLSDGTRKILSKLEGPVAVRFYSTQNAKELPVQLKIYAQRVEDLLNEFRNASGGKIEIKKFNPEPDSAAEDSANLDGIEAQPLPNGEAVYLGVAVSSLDQKVALPFLSPDRERLLEYDLVRAISRVTTAKKAVVGVMTPLPVFGERANPMMMQMGRQGAEPWVFLTELQSDFEVRQIGMEGDPIPDDVQMLLVIHPRDITDKAQYAIDQFVLRGGKLLAFLDATSLVDRPQNPQNPMMANMPGGPSNLEKLLKVWGIEFENKQVVADANYVKEIRGRDGRPQRNFGFLFVNAEGIDNGDPATAQLDNLLLPFAGVFKGTPADGLKQAVLIKTTKDTQLVDGMMANMSPESIEKSFKSSGISYPLAIRLTGKFKTAFPEGAPEAKKDEPADASKPDEKKEPPKKADSLKESKQDGVVVLVGDSDMLYDSFSVQVQSFLGQRIMVPFNGNLTFVQNLVEQMTGDSDLIAVRSRASINRPFTVVAKMQEEANRAMGNRITQVEEKLAETQKQLTEIQAKKEGNQRFILSPEQQQAIEKFTREKVAATKDLKELRKQLRQGIDWLETKTKLINIAVMPALVVLAGLTVAFVKRSRTAAK